MLHMQLIISLSMSKPTVARVESIVQHACQVAMVRWMVTLKYIVSKEFQTPYIGSTNYAIHGGRQLIDDTELHQYLVGK
jgi:hypothetical protein